MKNRLILMAWGVFFALYSVDSLAAFANCNFVDVRKSSSPANFNYSPDYRGKVIVAEYSAGESLSQACIDNLRINLVVTRISDNLPCDIQTDGRVLCNTVYYGSLYFNGITSTPTGEETASCNLFQGDKFFNANQKDICADTGVTTGGTAPAPLYCMSNWMGGIATESQHEFTNTQCSALDPDPTPDPDPNPDPDPDPDPEPEPEPDPGTPGGGTSPTSGTTGGTTGTSGSNPVNLVMDFKPVTERLDLLRADTKAHTNYLGQRINDASAAGVAATNSLKPLLEAIATKTDGVATAVREGNAEIKGELTTLNNTGKAIEGAIKDGNTALGEKLDGIKEGIDKLTEGEPIDGTAAGNNVALPDYDAAVQSGIEQIQSTVNDYAQTSGINSLGNQTSLAGMFAGAQSFSEVFDLARSGCSPIPFGSHGTFNVCGVAPTISMVLEIIIWALTALFIFHFVAGLITRERLT